MPPPCSNLDINGDTCGHCDGCIAWRVKEAVNEAVDSITNDLNDKRAKEKHIGAIYTAGLLLDVIEIVQKRRVK